MKTLVIIILSSIFGFSIGQAKNLPQNRIPTSVPANGGFKFEVKFGEKQTQFLVWSDAQGKHFSATNGVRSNAGDLSDKNYKFLNEQSTSLAALPTTSVRACQNSRMKISLKGGAESRSACLGLINKTAKKMTELADVLALLL